MYRSLATLGAVLILTGFAALASVYTVSDYKLRSVVDPPLFSQPVPSDSASVERGRHLARTRGCFGCHGQALEGRVFTDQWDWVERAVAPNLAAYARDNEAAVVEAAIRHGIGKNGKALWSMPSYNWVHLTDSDVADLIAFLRSTTVQSSNLPRPKLGLKARWSLTIGRDDHMNDLTGQMPALLSIEDDNSPMAHGQYIAMTACNECHGFDLRGEMRRGEIIPDLAIAAAYSTDDFRKLMRTGIALGERELRLMSMVARDRFAFFTDAELDALHTFLASLPSRPVPPDVPWRDAK
ncbi:MAG: cytochrome c [Rhodothermales bacterium]|nr:cytochrome c [Rhodothermales bacterium]